MGPQTHDDDRTGTEPYTVLIGPEGDERLIFSKGEDWLSDDNLQIACHTGYVDLEDWR